MSTNYYVPLTPFDNNVRNLYAEIKPKWRRIKLKNHYVLTDGDNIAHDLGVEKGVDGTKYFTFTRYGINNLDELAEQLNAFNEYDEEIMEQIYGVLLSCDICGDDILETKIHVNAVDQVVCAACAKPHR